jgi:hypothetical protein
VCNLLADGHPGILAGNCPVVAHTAVPHVQQCLRVLPLIILMAWWLFWEHAGIALDDRYGNLASVVQTSSATRRLHICLFNRLSVHYVRKLTTLMSHACLTYISRGE